MTEERLAELERLRSAYDTAEAEHNSFELSGSPPGSRNSSWPGPLHPQYPAYLAALSRAVTADDEYRDAAAEAVPELVAEVRRLRAEREAGRGL